MLSRRLARLIDARDDELAAALWAFAYFFCLLAGYYVLRPLRDEMGIESGVENMQWLFTATFVGMLLVVPLFGALSARVRRSRLVPLAYAFFVLNIIIFWALFRSVADPAWIARAFFVWVSVYNLFVVSVFWSFMADLFRREQARRLFGFVAAGGSAGAIAGPALAAALAQPLGPVNLLLPSAALLVAATLCAMRLARWARIVRAGEPKDAGDDLAAHDAPMGGSIWAGIRLVLASRYLQGICVFLFLYTAVSTFLYFQQAHVVEDAIADPALRTTVFAGMDFATNALALLTQLFLTGRIATRLGLAWTLALVPLISVAGLAALAVAPLLPVLVVVQVLRRAGNFSITRPAREMLFTVLDAESKYKAKNFIDTAVYRGGDAATGWLVAAIIAAGAGTGGIALLALPFAAAWVWLAYRLGDNFEKLPQAARATGARPRPGDTVEERI
ncbi:MAG TPA: MFS transporter [Gammaproteobacteria bacterium]|nr:MFS transporter [Gammaproteobacteria bacterium]